MNLKFFPIASKEVKQNMKYKLNIAGRKLYPSKEKYTSFLIPKRENNGI